MKYKLVNTEELNKLLKTARQVKQDERDEAYNNGYEDGKSEYEGQLEESEETVIEQKATIKSKNRKIAELEVELEVLNKQKSEARDVVTKRLANENIAADLKAREELVAKRETSVVEREEKLATKEVSEEDKQYKAGYADGVSDGVRKIGEITAADRKDAMDVAKISAASHTSSETLKAVLDGKVEATLTDKKTK
mgnify:CR=1 FL=1